MTSIRLSLAVLLMIGGCINRPRVEPSVETERTDEPELTWRELAARPLNFVPPPPLALAEIGPPPTALPPTSESSSRMADELPGADDNEDDWCSGSISASCSSAALDARGQPLWENRAESDGQVSVRISTEPDGWWRLDSCWRDSQGRVVSHQAQVTSALDGECTDWDVVTTKKGYDEHGELVYVEHKPEKFLAHWPEPRRDEDGTYAEIYQIVYEDGRPVRKTGYYASLDFSETQVMWTHNYAWVDGRLAQFDSFDSDGQWDQSKLYTWSGEFLRIDWFKPPVEDPSAGHKTEIYQRRGPGDYVQLYGAPETRWEYSTADDVEIVTKIVGELAVERRRFALVEDERRPLTVEQFAPDPVTVEEWDWSSPDRVIVERLEGRDVYMLDCSELPPIDSLVDPECPPPRPFR